MHDHSLFWSFDLSVLARSLMLTLQQFPKFLCLMWHFSILEFYISYLNNFVSNLAKSNQTCLHFRDMLLKSAGLVVVLKLVGNKSEGRIPKWVFQENKARQISWKTNTFYPMIRTRRTVVFSMHMSFFDHGSLKTAGFWKKTIYSFMIWSLFKTWPWWMSCYFVP